MTDIARLGETPFAVLDVETTGFNASVDRIIELAVLRLRPDGSVEDEFETLVNPRRDVGPTEIHNITAEDVLHAPDFLEIAADVADRLHGAVVVGHNVSFDLNFIASEYARIEQPMPQLPSLCTLQLAYSFLPIPSRKLRDCCAELGVELQEGHTALGDARAARFLLGAFLELAGEQGLRDLDALGCAPLTMPLRWARGPRSGRRCPRSEAARLATAARAFLPRLVQRLAGDEASNANEAEYMAVLDRALEDRRITPAEANALMEVAAEHRLTRADVERAHAAYMKGLVRAAWADSQVTDVELRDLTLVGELLGVPAARVIDWVKEGPATPVPVPNREDLRGKIVCFTGSLEAYSYQGVPISREVAEQLAQDAGLTTWPRVTKKVEVLVVADASTLSTKAQKAREYGTRIMAATAFFNAIGVAVEWANA